KGETTAMSNLGWLYANGQGVAQDYAKARRWYEKAADKGETTAMLNLGLLYDNGQGVAQDYAKAREWYEKAAAKGNANATINLKKLPISEAAGTGRYAQALKLQEALAAKVRQWRPSVRASPATRPRRNSTEWHGTPCLHESSRKPWPPPIARTRSFPTTSRSKPSGR